MLAEDISVASRASQKARPVWQPDAQRPPRLVRPDRQQEIDQHVPPDVAEYPRASASADPIGADHAGAVLREALPEAGEQVASQQAGIGIDLDRHVERWLLPRDRR